MALILVTVTRPDGTKAAEIVHSSVFSAPTKTDTKAVEWAAAFDAAEPTAPPGAEK